MPKFPNPLPSWYDPNSLRDKYTPGPWERETQLQIKEVMRLEEINADLLAALEVIGKGRTKDGIQALMDKCREWHCMPRGHAIPGYGELVTQVARAAIAKANGQ